MAKKSLDAIFKNGVNFKFKLVDYNQSSNNNRLKKIKEKQDAIVKRTDIDWKELESIIVTNIP